MTHAPQNPVSGKVLPPKRAASSTAESSQAFAALGLIATEVVGYLKVREQERARREEIAAYRDLEVQKIRAAERILADYFQSAFAERAKTLEDMFTRLDEAIGRGDDGMVRATLGGIVDIAKSSPLASVGDLSQIRAALDDPKHTWQF